jgi:hypothetical protein
MPYPADVYSCASGQSIAGGRFLLPAWVPAAGTFANISKNTLNSVRPAGWGTGTEITGPFANWSGGARADDFSKLGAYLVHGSGDLLRNETLWGGVGAFDLDTLMWQMLNVPPAPLLEEANAIGNRFGEANAYYDLNGESTQSGLVGWPYVPHNYTGLVYQRAKFGGGTKGSLLRNWVGGTWCNKVVHRFDLSPSNMPTRVIDNTSSSGSTYPMAAVDEARGGYWLLSANGAGALVFVKFSDWSRTEYPVTYNEYGDNVMVYIPAPWDCLVGLGRGGGGGLQFVMYVCPIVNNVPTAWTQITPAGTPPVYSDANPGAIKCGGQWFKSLQKIVSYVGAGSTGVHKLTPPAPGALTTGQWVWDVETLTGVAGATPSKNPQYQNGSWGRFIEFPSARCAIWCDGIDQPVQAWRLQGM